MIDLQWPIRGRIDSWRARRRGHEYWERNGGLRPCRVDWACVADILHRGRRGFVRFRKLRAAGRDLAW